MLSVTLFPSHRCISFTVLQDRRYRKTFAGSGLRSATTDLGDGTVMHFWVPKTHKPGKPNLLLIHGVGANAMWQWYQFIPRLTRKFNVYVPDLVFFGKSYTSRPERTEGFQAECVMRSMEALGVRRMEVVGLSYGGFVAYSMAAQFPAAVERVVIVASGVCMEEKDLEEGLFKVGSVEDAIAVLLAQTPEKMRELMRFTFYKPAKIMPSCFLVDFIDVMCTENLKERKELIIALHKNRKLSDLPRINQPTLIIWGDKDQIFPLELAHRLKRHLGENAELAIIKNAGHAVNVEKWKEMYKHMKAFLVDQPISSKDELDQPISSKDEHNGNNLKAD